MPDGDVEVQAKPRASVRGCILTLLFIALLGYGAFAGFGFAWWGRGFAGALAARHAPERIRAATTVHIYDYVIVTERDRIVFRNSLWMSVRRGVVSGLAAATLLFLFAVMKRRTLPRGLMPIVTLLTAIGAFAISNARAREVSLPRGAPVQLHAQWYSLGGGQVGTKQTKEEESGWQIATSDGLVLIRLPWNSEEDADLWRDLIAEKLAR